MTGAAARRRRIRPTVVWGVVVGLVTVASPLAFWWLDPSTVYAFGLVLIAAIYIGFAVADGRPKVIVAESTVASVFVVVAAVAVTGSVWLIVAGLFGHGLKTCGSIAASLSPTCGGGRRSAWSLTGLPRQSSPA